MNLPRRRFDKVLSCKQEEAINLRNIRTFNRQQNKKSRLRDSDFLMEEKQTIANDLLEEGQSVANETISSSNCEVNTIQNEATSSVNFYDGCHCDLDYSDEKINESEDYDIANVLQELHQNNNTYKQQYISNI